MERGDGARARLEAGESDPLAEAVPAGPEDAGAGPGPAGDDPRCHAGAAVSDADASAAPASSASASSGGAAGALTDPPADEVAGPGAVSSGEWGQEGGVAAAHSSGSDQQPADAAPGAAASAAAAAMAAASAALAAAPPPGEDAAAPDEPGAPPPPEQAAEQAACRDGRLRALEAKLAHFRHWLAAIHHSVATVNPNLVKNSRRIYVGGVPAGTNDVALKSFFNSLMQQCGALVAPGSAVTSARLSQDKGFAFLELRSVEEATNCMAFDGVLFRDAYLKVRRPSNYDPIAAAVLAPIAPDPTIDTRALRMCRTVVDDTWAKLFIGGLPADYGEEQVRELLAPFGSLKSFNLVMDKTTGKSKGYAFCEFREDVTDRVAAALNGRVLDKKVLTVKRALEGGSERGQERQQRGAPLGAPYHPQQAQQGQQAGGQQQQQHHHSQQAQMHQYGGGGGGAYGGVHPQHQQAGGGYRQPPQPGAASSSSPSASGHGGPRTPQPWAAAPVGPAAGSDRDSPANSNASAGSGYQLQQQGSGGMMLPQGPPGPHPMFPQGPVMYGPPDGAPPAMMYAPPGPHVAMGGGPAAPMGGGYGRSGARQGPGGSSGGGRGGCDVQGGGGPRQRAVVSGYGGQQGYWA